MRTLIVTEFITARMLARRAETTQTEGASA